MIKYLLPYLFISNIVFCQISQESQNQESLKGYKQELLSNYRNIKEDIYRQINLSINHDSLFDLLRKIDSFQLKIPAKGNVRSNFKDYVLVTTEYNESILADFRTFLLGQGLFDTSVMQIFSRIESSNKDLIKNLKKGMEIRNLYFENDLILLKVTLLRKIARNLNIERHDKYSFSALVVPERYIIAPGEEYKAKILIAKFIEDIEFTAVIDDTTYHSVNGEIMFTRKIRDFNKYIEENVVISYILDGDTITENLILSSLSGDNYAIIGFRDEEVIYSDRDNILYVKVPGVADENILLFAKGTKITGISPGVFSIRVMDKDKTWIELYISAQKLDLGNQLIEVKKIKIK